MLLAKPHKRHQTSTSPLSWICSLPAEPAAHAETHGFHPGSDVSLNAVVPPIGPHPNQMSFEGAPAHLPLHSGTYAHSLHTPDSDICTRHASFWSHHRRSRLFSLRRLLLFLTIFGTLDTYRSPVGKNALPRSHTSWLFSWGFSFSEARPPSVSHPCQDGFSALTVMSGTPNRHACADALKDWFEVQIDTWVSTPVASQLRNVPISTLVAALIENAYAFISWEHVARAFRLDS